MSRKRKGRLQSARLESFFPTGQDTPVAKKPKPHGSDAGRSTQEVIVIDSDSDASENSSELEFVDVMMSAKVDSGLRTNKTGLCLTNGGEMAPPRRSSCSDSALSGEPSALLLPLEPPNLL